MQRGDATTPNWATRFDDTAAQALLQRDVGQLVTMWPDSDGRTAHPTPDHWWPLLYALGATDERDEVSFPILGFELGSLSMRSVRFG